MNRQTYQCPKALIMTVILLYRIIIVLPILTQYESSFFKMTNLKMYFFPTSLYSDFLPVIMRNIVFVKDESTFHTCVNARVLKSQNDVIVSASPESNLPTLALPCTSL